MLAENKSGRDWPPPLALRGRVCSRRNSYTPLDDSTSLTNGLLGRKNFSREGKLSHLLWLEVSLIASIP